MKNTILSLAAVTLLATGAYAQMGQGSAPKNVSMSAPTRTPSYSGGGSGGSYKSSNSNSPSYSTPDRGSNSGGSDSGSDRYNGGGSSSSSSSSGNSGSYSNSSNSSYSSGSYSGYGYSGSSSSSSGGNSVYYPQGNYETIRKDAMKGIRETLSSQDKTSQYHTVSGTEPSVVTGTGGTRLNINPANLETVDGKPVSGDIEVELKELDGPAKMGPAGAPTMSNGGLLISGGSYFIGMTSGGEELRLKKGANMQVDLPMLTNDPEMEIYTGDVDDAGNVNWQPTGRPLTGLGQVRTNETPNGNNGGNNNNNSGNENGNNNNGGNNTTSPSRPGNNNNNNSGNTGNSGNSNIGGAVQYYSPVTLTNTGWVNVDKGFRSGIKMFVEVEGADPLSTQVFMSFKNVRSLAEGAPDRSYTTNDFIFESIPKNEDVKIIAVSKVHGKVYAGEVKAKTKARDRVVVELKESTASDAAKMFEN